MAQTREENNRKRRELYWSRPEQEREARKERYQKDRERQRENGRRWRENNPEKWREIVRKSKARQRAKRAEEAAAKLKAESES